MSGINKGYKAIELGGLFWVWTAFSSCAFAISNQRNVDSPSTEIVKTLISQKNHPYLSKQASPKNQTAMEKLYGLSQFNLIWLNNFNNADSALGLLESASEQGLNSQDYDAWPLRWHWYRIKIGQTTKAEDFALFDTALSAAIFRYLSDLYFGRVNPRQAKFHIKQKDDCPDFVELIIDAVRKDQVSTLANRLEPRLGLYDDLRQALSDYREIAQHYDHFQFRFKPSLRPGDRDPQVVFLRHLLTAFGDYPKQQDNFAAFNDPTYGSEIVTAVKRFQLRHGLLADGIIGRKTLSALNTPISTRIHQLELALERLRWLPKLPAGPLVAVNIPSFRLWAFDSLQTKSQPLTMKVVVGQASDWQTPVFTAEMQYLYFSPFWNVPNSIFKEEILPEINQDPHYILRKNMELVNRFGSRVEPVALNEESLALLKKGELRLRQRPGLKNALGRVKFIFPNRYGIYMHDTPAKSLFRYSRRDFSHGCIRVEKPTALAEFVLSNKPGWNRKKIRQAMAKSNRKVNLKKPIPVIIYYLTAIVDQGQVYFLEDIYGLDEILTQKLQQQMFVNNKSPMPDSPGIKMNKI